jgi:hypothetical protein
MAQPYRLIQELHATTRGSAQRVIVTLPQGSFISVVGPVAEEPGLLEFVYDGQRLTMFAEDLARKAELSPSEKTRGTSAAAPSIPARENIVAAVPNLPEEAGPVGTTQEGVSGVKVRRFDSSGRERL